MSDELNVMLIDDDPHTRDIFQMVMDHHQYNIDVYGDAESALQVLPSVSPDVVVIDLFLPGLDGYQAFDRIQKARMAPNSRFIATTAYYTNDTQAEVMERGFDGFIAKPLNPEQLVPYLKSVL